MAKLGTEELATLVMKYVDDKDKETLTEPVRSMAQTMLTEWHAQSHRNG